jgi:hypothetical protein
MIKSLTYNRSHMIIGKEIKNRFALPAAGN